MILATSVATAFSGTESKIDLGAIRRRAELYDNRYGLADVLDKEVDNKGNGDERLYGTRNLRVVLRGVLYRGGANNAFHRNGARANSNPLPTEGLENLCEEGFATSVYLYPTNFDTAPQVKECNSRVGRSHNVLSYRQLNALDDRELWEILHLVRDTILDGSKGPMYAHCWNGWHASGLVAATALMQFCGLSNNDAVDYWVHGTDGNQAGYDNVRRRIVRFRPDPHLSIPRTLSAIVCPELRSVGRADRPIRPGSTLG